MYRDMSVPYTEEEFVVLREKFCACPSYNPQDDAIRTCDFENFILNDMRYYRTPEQFKSLTDYWDTNKGGKVDWETYYKFASSLTENLEEYFSVYVHECDKDKNGFISVDEFGEILKLITGFDSQFSGITFEEFLKEADANRDGKVSVQECIDWIFEIRKKQK